MQKKAADEAKLITPHIVGLGSYLPSRTIDNQFFSNIVDTNDEWIRSRTGISARRFAAEEEYPSDMGYYASIKALKSAQMQPEEIQMILTATMSPDYHTPSCAALIQDKLGSKAAAMDIQAACSGFLYAIQTAAAFVASNTYENVLVVATEKMSSLLNYKDRTTCILFGDGAAAAIVSSKQKGMRLIESTLGADGSGADLVIIPAGGTRHPCSISDIEEGKHLFHMKGKELFKSAIRASETSAKLCLEKAKVDVDEIDWLLLHQNNRRMMDAIAKAIGIHQSKLYSVVEKYGNTSSAGVAVALTELCESGRVKEADKLLLSVCGGGLTWGALLLEYRGV